MNKFVLVSRLRLLAQAPAFAGSGKVRANHAYMLIPLRRGSCPSLALSVWQLRAWRMEPWLSRRSLSGPDASRIREIGALALAVATINSFEPQLNLRHRTETRLLPAARGGHGLDCLRIFYFLRSRSDKAGVL